MVEAEVDLDDPELAYRIYEWAQQGMSRPEIALKLGLNLVSLAEREAANPRFAEIMWFAEVERVGYFNGIARRQLAEPSFRRSQIWFKEPPPLRPPAEPAPYQRRWRHGGFY